jgi:hypothetical protein
MMRCDQPDSGWMGDRRRGASMGRCSVQPDQISQRVRLRAVKLDSGGYDRGGAYWGHGGYLWEATTPDGALFLTGRVHNCPVERRAALARLCQRGGATSTIAIDREVAKAEVRAIYPAAQFYR